jgi:hypothetical protein
MLPQMSLRLPGTLRAKFQDRGKRRLPRQSFPIEQPEWFVHHVRVARCHQVHILRLACMHLGPRCVLPGNQLAPFVLGFGLNFIQQYGYHISALNQIQAVLTCRATTPSSSYGFSTCIPMSDATFSLITSMFTVGGFLGSCTASNVMNRRGRKAALQLSGLLVAVGSGIMGVASSIVLLLLGRYVLISISTP